MAKCLNGIDSISFDNPADEQRYQVHLEATGSKDAAWEAFVAEKAERENQLAKELSKYTLPGFTPEQQSQVVAGLTKRVYDQILENENREDELSPDQIFRKVHGMMVRHFSEKVDAGENAVAQEVLKVLDNWNEVEKLIEDKLGQMGFQRTRSTRKISKLDMADLHAYRSDTDAFEGETADYEKKRFDDGARFEQNSRDTASSRLKMFLASTRKVEPQLDDTGNPVPAEGYLGIKLFVSFDSLWDELTSTLADQPSPTLQQYLAALKASGSPQMKEVARRIQEAPVQIQSEFVSVMTKTFIELTQALWKPIWKGKNIVGYKMRGIRSDQHSMPDMIRKHWVENQKASPLVKQGPDGHLEIDDMYMRQVFNRYANEHQDASTDEDYEKAFKDFLDRMGIILPLNQIKALREHAQEAFNTSFQAAIDPERSNSFISILRTGFEESTEGVDNETPRFEVQNPLVGHASQSKVMRLARFVAKSTEHTYTPSYRNIEKKLIYAYQDYHHLARQMQKLKTKKGLQEMMQSSFAKNSIWGKEMLDHFVLRDRFKLQYLDGIRKETSQRAFTRSDMAEAENIVYQLTRFQDQQQSKVAGKRKAAFVSTTHSDKSVTPVISHVAQDIDITVSDGSVTSISDDTMGLIMEAVKAEINRISRFQSKIKGSDQLGDKYADYQKGAETFFLSPWLNKQALEETYGADVANEVWASDGTLLIDETAMKHMRRATKDAVLSEIALQKERMEDMGIIKEEDGRVTAMMDNSYLSNVVPVEDRRDAITWGVADYVINYMIFYTESYRLFSGDPAQHFKQGNSPDESIMKTLENLQKRLAKDLAPIIQGNWESGDEFTKATIADRVISSDYADYYKDLLGGEDFYSEIESTDAQEYTTLEEHIRVMRAYGMIADSVYDSILAKINKANGGYFELSQVEKKVVFQPMKPLTVNYKYDPDADLTNIVYTKSSSFPLIPELTAGMEIDHLRRAMEKEGVDRVAHASADKMGIKKTQQFWSNPTEFTFEKDALQTLTRDGFGLQQVIPTKDPVVLTLSQMNKLLGEGISDLTFEIDGEELSGQDLIKAKEEIRKKLYHMSDKELRSELGIQLDENNNVTISDLSKMRDVILSEAKRRGWSHSEIESLELNDAGDDFRIPLAFHPASRRIESLLLSLIRNRVTNQYMFGKGYVQGSSAGFKHQLEGESNIDRSKVAWVEGYDPSTPLRHMREEGGEVKPAQIIVPWHFAKMNLGEVADADENGVLRIDPEKVDPEVLKVIGARIPNQGHNSMVAMEIVGFYGPEYGSLALVPDEIVVQMGSDFDIDKLYTYLTQYSYSEDAQSIVKRSDDETAMGLKQQYMDLHWKVLTHPKMLSKIMAPLDLPDLSLEKDLVLESQEQEGSISPVFPRVQIHDFIQNRAGKELVAVFSNANVAHAVFQNADLRFKKDEDGNSLSDQFRFSDDSGKDLHFTRLSGHGTSRYQRDGEWIERTKHQVISALQSAAVDNAKDNILGPLNLNLTTANVAALMAMLETENGVSMDTRYIARFLSQKIIRDFVYFYELSTSSLDTEYPSDNVTWAAQQALERNSLQDTEASGRSMSPKHLASLLDDSSPTKKWGEDQVQILETFMALYRGAEEMEKVRKGLLFADTVGAGPSIPLMLDRLEKFHNVDNTSIAGVENLMESEYAEAQRIALERGNLYFTSFFGYGEPIFRSLIDTLKKELGRKTVRPEEEQQAMGELRSFLYTDLGVFGDIDAERKRLMYGENTLTKRVRKGQKLDWGKNNFFLVRLSTEMGRQAHEPDLVKFRGSKGARLDQVEVLRALSSMITSNNEIEKKLAQDLVTYAFINGGQANPVSFTEHIPMAYLDYIGFSNKLSGVDFNDGRLRERFIEQYIQHNPELTPSITDNGRLSKRVQSVKGREVLLGNEELGILRNIAGTEVNPFAFHTGRGRTISNLYIRRGEQPDGTVLYEKADILGTPVTREYQASSNRATSPVQKSTTRPTMPSERYPGSYPTVSKPKVKNPPTGTEERTETLFTPESELHNFVSPEYGEQSGMERVDYALSQVQNEALQPLVKVLRKALPEVNPGLDFEVVKELPVAGAHGVYRHRQKLVEIADLQTSMGRAITRQTVEETLVHELLHAATKGLLQDDVNMSKELHAVRKEMRKRVNSLRELALEDIKDTEQWKEFQKILSLRKQGKSTRAMTTRERDIFYPLTNNDEFLVGVLTRAGFQRFLNGIEVGDSTLWERVVQAISEIMKQIGNAVGIDIRSNSALAEAMSASLTLIEGQVTEETESDVVTTTDPGYRYYGATYEIVLEKRGDTLVPVDVKGYKGKDDRKQKLLDAYREDPDVDPQTGRPFRNIDEYEGVEDDNSSEVTPSDTQMSNETDRNYTNVALYRGEVQDAIINGDATIFIYTQDLVPVLGDMKTGDVLYKKHTQADGTEVDVKLTYQGDRTLEQLESAKGEGSLKDRVARAAPNSFEDQGINRWIHNKGGAHVFEAEVMPSDTQKSKDRTYVQTVFFSSDQVNNIWYNGKDLSLVQELSILAADLGEGDVVYQKFNNEHGTQHVKITYLGRKSVDDFNSTEEKVLDRMSTEKDSLRWINVMGWAAQRDERHIIQTELVPPPELTPEQEAARDKRLEEDGSIHRDEKKYMLPGGFYANKDQQKAIDKLTRFLESDNEIFVLVGRGGTGKTTVISAILDQAPVDKWGMRPAIGGTAISHAATNRLSESIPESRTMASMLGIKLNENTGKFQPDPYARRKGIPIEDLDIVVVDETSMVNETLMDEILNLKQSSAKVIFMGDNAQLPPIRKPNSKHKGDSKTFSLVEEDGHLYAKLTERLRSGEEHPLVAISDKIVANIESSDPEVRVIEAEDRVDEYDAELDKGILFLESESKALDKLVADIKKTGEAEDPINWVRALTFNNQNHNAPQSVKNINRKVRERLFGDKAETTKWIPGEVAVAYDSFIPPESSVISPIINNSQSMKIVDVLHESVDDVKVEKYGKTYEFQTKVLNLKVQLEDNSTHRIPVVHPDFEQEFTKELARLRKKAMSGQKVYWTFFFRLKERYVDLHHGYAINAHKAQGQTYRNVYVFEDNILGKSNPSDAKSKNQALYVAITRASHKVAVVSGQTKDISSQRTTAPGTEKKSQTKGDAPAKPGRADFVGAETWGTGKEIDFSNKTTSKSTSRNEVHRGQPSYKAVNLKVNEEDFAAMLTGLMTHAVGGKEIYEKAGLEEGETGVFKHDANLFYITYEGELSVEEAGGKAQMEKRMKTPSTPEGEAALNAWLEGVGKMHVYKFKAWGDESNNYRLVGPETSTDIGSDVAQFMKTLSSDQREAFRTLRQEGMIKTKCN